MIDLNSKKENSKLVEVVGEDKIIFEIAEIRVENIVEELKSLRYLHSEALKNELFAKLGAPEIRQAFSILQINHEEFENMVSQVVSQIKTTRPTGMKRASGAGRPRLHAVHTKQFNAHAIEGGLA